MLPKSSHILQSWYLYLATTQNFFLTNVSATWAPKATLSNQTLEEIRKTGCEQDNSCIVDNRNKEFALMTTIIIGLVVCMMMAGVITFFWYKQQKRPIAGVAMEVDENDET